MKEIIRFYFVPIEAEEVTGDILAEIEMPEDVNERTERIREIEDAISSYVDTVEAWSFEGLASDIIKSFDENARIITPTTFFI